MLKAVINVFDFNTLPDVLKSEYKLHADGSYRLDLGPMFVTDKDPAGLLSALEKEREESKKIRSIADRLEAEKKKAELDKITDVEQLKLHFAQELEKAQKQAERERKEAELQLLAQREAVAKQHVRQEALKLASDVFDKNAAIMLPHVEAALKPTVGDTPGLQIVDPMTGLPAIDQSLESYKKSLLTNPLFKDMIVATKASGGSANDGTKNVLATATHNADGTPRTFKDYSPGELQRLKKTSPEEFQQIFDNR